MIKKKRLQLLPTSKIVRSTKGKKNFKICTSYLMLTVETAYSQVFGQEHRG